MWARPADRVVVPVSESLVPIPEGSPLSPEGGGNKDTRNPGSKKETEPLPATRWRCNFVQEHLGCGKHFFFLPQEQILSLARPDHGRPCGRNPQRQQVPKGSGPSPDATQGLLSDSSLRKRSHSSRVPEQSLWLCVPGSPSCTRESSPARNGGDLLPLGRASATPLSLVSTPGQTREGTCGSGFHCFSGSLGLGCPSSPNSNPGAPASRSPALSLPGHPGATIGLQADRAAAGLTALAVVCAVLVPVALLRTIRNRVELGAHAGFICSGALGWLGAENCQEEPSPVPPPYPLPTPRPPNFNPKDFGFSGPGAPITSSPGEGSLTLESSLMPSFRAPSPLGT